MNKSKINLAGMMLAAAVASISPTWVQPSSVAYGQMVTGSDMKDFGSVLDVGHGGREPVFSVENAGSTIPANILWPGEQGEFRIRIHNHRDQPIRAAGRAELIPWGTRGIPGDIWTPQVFRREGEVLAYPVQIDVPAGQSQEITVKPEVPETKGGYALVIDLGPEHGRRFVTSVVRTFKPNPQRLQHPKMSLDYGGADMLSRLGVQAVRHGVDFVPLSHPDYPRFRQNLRDELKRMSEHNISALIMIGAGPADMPLGRGRPHLSDDDVMLGGKEDLAWSPSLDEEYRQFVKDICMEHGWPKGPVTAFSLWNEPWEGLSISGWQADMIRYRDLYRIMAEAVHAARAEGDVEVLVAGADSSSNTFDKFFSDGSDEFLKYLDAVTIHYQGMASPSTHKAWINRPQGRVLVWDTESWVANVDDRVASVIAVNRAAGYDRSMGVYGGNIHRHGTAWPVAAAVGAAQEFIGQREFDRLLFGHGLPWVMLFNGQHNPDDGTIVVVGDIGEAFGNDNVLMRTVRGLEEIEHDEQLYAQLQALPADSPRRAELRRQIDELLPLSGGTLTLANPGGRFALYDFYGNRVTPAGESITVPLDHRGFFLRADGSPGSFAALVEAVNRAEIRGIEPLEIIPHDMTAPIESRPTMRIDVTNVLNRPVEGQLALTLGDLKLEYPRELSLAPHERRTIEARVIDGAAAADNHYPLRAVFNSPESGMAVHEETMRVNHIARRAIKVDGTLDDWAGVIPQPVSGERAGRTMTEAAWWPMASFDESAPAGQATGYLAYDDQYFYFAAKIADTTPEAGTLRFETRDDDQFFYPPLALEYDKERTLLKKDGVEKGDEARDARLPALPDGGERQVHYWTNTDKNLRIGVDLTLPADRLTRVSVYVGRHGLHPNGQFARVLNAETGEQLVESRWDNLWDGGYVRFTASGKVRLVLQTGGDWYPIRCYGVFLDDAGERAQGGGPVASDIGMDYDTGGDWAGKIGSLGHYFVNGPARLPDGVTVTPVEQIEKKEHAWPEGVRNFSYRKWPILPAPYWGGAGCRYDSVQIAFNAIPVEQEDMLASPPGTPAGFIDYKTSDYEYALNKVAPQFGGGTEVWRLLVPGMPRKHFYPRQPASPLDGPAKGARLEIVHEPGSNTRIVEAAIPWTEMPHVKALADSGQPVKFSFRVNDAGAESTPELGANRSVAKRSGMTFHVDWSGGWANELEFGWGD